LGANIKKSRKNHIKNFINVVKNSIVYHISLFPKKNAVVMMAIYTAQSGLLKAPKGVLQSNKSI
jgi:hypothetical protein